MATFLSLCRKRDSGGKKLGDLGRYFYRSWNNNFFSINNMEQSYGPIYARYSDGIKRYNQRIV